MVKVKRILVPVDFSSHAEEALDYARALAAFFEATLEVVHVVEEPAFPAFYGAAYKGAHGQLPPDLEEEARLAMERLAEAVRGADVERGIGYYVRRGRAAREIVQLAKEHDVDLIVIGSQGLTGMDRLVLGSVAEKVVRGAPCPVFVIKQKRSNPGQQDE